MARAARRERRERRHDRQVLEREVRRTRARPDWVVSALAGIFLVSGAAGLIHEIVWSRLLSHVFGATTLAVSTVLAAFMGGLALGSWWIGRRTAMIADRRRLYARLEIAIGIAAVLVPLVLRLVEPVYGALWRRFHLSFAVFGVIRFVIASTILLGPTAMMGATLPVLADYLAGLRGRKLAPQWLYTANLAGGVLGVAIAGFLLMPALGVGGTIAVGATLNVAAGVVALALPALPDDAAPPPAATAPVPVVRPHPLLLVAALASGLLSFATQVAWTRVLILIVGSTAYAFSSVLLAYLISLGAGSAWASRRGARIDDVGPELGTMHLLMAVALLAAVLVVNRMPFWYASVWATWKPAGLPGIVLMNTTLVLALLFPSVLFAGTILPLVLIGSLPRDARGTGAAVGGVYAVNTVGAVVGAVLTGFVLIPRLGSQATLLGVALVATALGLVFVLRGPRSVAGTAGALVATAVVVIGVAVHPRWQPMPLNNGVFDAGADEARSTARRHGHLLYHREGPTASVVVVQWNNGRTLSINGRVNASDLESDMLTQVLMAELPVLFAPHTDDVFMIGWGSGMTAGALLDSPVKRLRAVELEPAVIEASHFFQRVNHHPWHHPRLDLHEDDARHLLLADAQPYDAIVSEPSHPWVTGVSNLFTQDFFELAARRLRPEGVFVQWVQNYEIPFESFRSILATFQSVFPETLVFMPPNFGDCILVGSRMPIPVSLAELTRRWGDRRVRAENARVKFTRPEHVLATLVVGPDDVRKLAHGAPINTDDDMYVEYQAPRNMVRGDSDSVRIVETLLNAATPIEKLLVDPDALLGNRDRLAAFIEGMKRGERFDAPRYEKRLAALPP